MDEAIINYLIISGQKEALIKFKATAIKYDFEYDEKGFTLSLNSLIPCPLDINTFAGDLLKARAKWCMENWGTTYLYDLSERDITENSYTVRFKSTYGYPLKACIKFSSDYPELTFLLDYYGRSLGYCGECTMKNGQVIAHKHYVGDEYDAQFVSVTCKQKTGESYRDSHPLMASPVSRAKLWNKPKK